jgi:hypothetical protein
MIFPSRFSALAKSILFEPLDLASGLLPRRWRAPQDARGIAPWLLLAHGGTRGLSRRLSEAGIEGLGFSDEVASVDPGFLVQLCADYLAMKKVQEGLPRGWQPGVDWGPLLESSWAPVRKAMENNDTRFVDEFFKDMFRNDAIAGLWGGTGMFERFRDADRWTLLCRASQVLSHFLWWRQAYGRDVERVRTVPLGRPWGWKIKGHLVVEPTLEYDGHAQDILRLVSEIPNPVVLEIGGGYGGLARQLVRERPDLAYMGVDLPENAALQAYFLSRALPDRAVALHANSAPGRIAPGSLHLMPNWALRDLPKGVATVVVNFRSFAEIDTQGLEAIFGEISRLAPRWIYQENLCAPRGDGLVGITLSRQPELAQYRTVRENPSPWLRYGAGSDYICAQKLQERSGSGSKALSNLAPDVPSK